MSAHRLGRLDADSVDTAILITLPLMGSFIFTSHIHSVPSLGITMAWCFKAAVVPGGDSERSKKSGTASAMSAINHGTVT